MKTEPLKANQVRTRINKNKIRTYYIVAEDHNRDFHCLWFRTLMDQPMMLITPDATYKPKEEDVVILDNLNLLTDTFDDIVKEEIDGIPTPSKEDTQTATIAHLEELIEQLQKSLDTKVTDSMKYESYKEHYDDISKLVIDDISEIATDE